MGWGISEKGSGGGGGGDGGEGGGGSKVGVVWEGAPERGGWKGCLSATACCSSFCSWAAFSFWLFACRDGPRPPRPGVRTEPEGRRRTRQGGPRAGEDREALTHSHTYQAHRLSCSLLSDFCCLSLLSSVFSFPLSLPLSETLLERALTRAHLNSLHLEPLPPSQYSTI